MNRFSLGAVVLAALVSAVTAEAPTATRGAGAIPTPSESRALKAHAPADTSRSALPSLPGNEVRAKGMFAYHKELLPLDKMDIITFFCVAIGLLIAAGGGIGGGGILVPLLMIMLDFRPKHAIALSNLTIFGGSIANVAFNIQKRQPNGKGMIDWDIIVIMEPSTIAGAVIGSFMSKYLPDFVLTVCLSIVLSLLAWRTLEKGIKMIRKENEDSGKAEGETELNSFIEVPQADAVSKRQSMVDGDNPRIPWGKVLGLVLCFAGCIVLTILKGSGHGSIIGVQCGSSTFWILSIATIPWVILFGVVFRNLLMKEHEEKLANNHNFQEGEIKWDSKSTITYPLLCTVAGLFAGLFGVGGGIVKGPLMLEMGVNPSVAAATAATMIVFTTSAACVSFVSFGLLEGEYGMAGFFMGLVCTAVGQVCINAWMKAAKRQSPPVLSIGAVMALSTLLVAFEAYGKFQQESREELFATSSICSVHE